jgi:hypothetical protein
MATKAAQDGELLGRLTQIFVDSAQPGLYSVPKSFSDVSTKAWQSARRAPPLGHEAA